MFLNSNYILYAGLIQVIKRGTAEILEENEYGIFLRDTVSNAFMLAADDFETGIDWLKKYEGNHYHLMSVFRTDIADFARDRYGFTDVLNCFQAIYMPTTPPVLCGNLQVIVAMDKDFAVIADNYKMLSEWELKEIIHRGELFLGYQDKTMIGFVGQHLEGSMGLLEVLPQYRGKGFGTELEGFMISHMLENGLIPFCQIEVQNEKSLGLQQKLGLTISNEHVYWLS